jgi:hypothetical protein
MNTYSTYDKLVSLDMETRYGNCSLQLITEMFFVNIQSEIPHKEK